MDNGATGSKKSKGLRRRLADAIEGKFESPSSEEKGEWQGERFFTYWFTPQMTNVARAELG